MAEPIQLPEAVQSFLKTNYGFVLETDQELTARLVTQLVHTVQHVTTERDHLRSQQKMFTALDRDRQDMMRDYGKTDAQRMLEDKCAQLNGDVHSMEGTIRHQDRVIRQLRTQLQNAQKTVAALTHTEDEVPAPKQHGLAPIGAAAIVLVPAK